MMTVAADNPKGLSLRGDPILSEDQAAELVGLGIESFRVLVKEKGIPNFRASKKSSRIFRLSELLDSIRTKD